MSRFRVSELEGKYYGTYVMMGGIPLGRIWSGDHDGEPSERELKRWRSIESFRENCCDSHFETAQDYHQAVGLVAHLNAVLDD
jgi:hypothetical protein